MTRMLTPAFVKSVEQLLRARARVSQPGDLIEYTLKCPSDIAMDRLGRKMKNLVAVKSIDGCAPGEVATYRLGPWAIFVNTSNVVVAALDELDVLTGALLTAFGGGRVKREGFFGRGGHLKLTFKGPTPRTVRQVTELVKGAIKVAGFRDQKCGDFPTRELDDGDLGYYVERGEWEMYVINLGGTAKRPYLTITA